MCEIEKATLVKSNENIIYQNYSVADIDKYKENLKSMSVLELFALKPMIENELNRLESCKAMLNISDDSLNLGDLSNQIMNANTLDTHDFHDDDKKEFTEFYFKYKPILEDFLNDVNKTIADKSASVQTTSSLTNDLINILEKKKKHMVESTTEYPKCQLKDIDLSINIFKTRYKLDFIANALNDILKHIANIRIIKYALTSNYNTYIGAISSAISEKGLFSAVAELKQIGFSVKEIMILMGFLNILYLKSKKNKVWIEVFLINLSDIYHGVYDIAECPSDNYIENIETDIHPNIVKIQSLLQDFKDMTIPMEIWDFAINAYCTENIE